jgi:hypothetical protein
VKRARCMSARFVCLRSWSRRCESLFDGREAHDRLVVKSEALPLDRAIIKSFHLFNFNTGDAQKHRTRVQVTLEN